MLSVVLIWGVNFTVVKLGLRSFSPLAFNALRFSLATVIMLAILRLRPGPRPTDAGGFAGLRRADLLQVILLGLGGHTLYQVLFINGIARTTAGNTSLLMATSPIFVAILGFLLRVERAGRMVWAGILLSFTGTVLVILGGGPVNGDGSVSLGSRSVLGDLFVLAGAMIWAAYTTGSKPLLARYSPLQLTALTMVAGTIPLDLISLPALLHQDWHSVPSIAWGSLLFSAVFAVVMWYVFWYTSVQRVGSARTAVYANLTPVIAITVAWLALGDRFAPLQAVGAVVVLAGIMLTRRGRTP